MRGGGADGSTPRVVTADREPDKLPTTVSGAPVATVAPGPLPLPRAEDAEEGRSGEAEVRLGDGVEGVMEVDEVRQGGS